MIDGARLGVLVLLAILLVGAGRVRGLLPLPPQAREAQSRTVELDAEWSELQRASRTS